MNISSHQPIIYNTRSNQAIIYKICSLAFTKLFILCKRYCQYRQQMDKNRPQTIRFTNRATINSVNQTSMKNVLLFSQRFGTALVRSGQLHLKGKQYATDFTPIDDRCLCSTCQNYTRAFLHSLIGKESVACHLISIHNLTYQVSHE